MVPQFLSKTKTQTDQEKSVLLAKAMEWVRQVGMVWYWKDDHADYVIGSPKDLGTQIPNLYDPANMALAWRVHLWALTQTDIGSTYHEWWFKEWPWYEQNQRLWLDQILTLAIESGVIEEK